MKAWMFAGQGSQQRGAGAQLFTRFPALVEEADDLLGFSLRKLCMEGDAASLADTRVTQPLVFVTNALAAQARIEDGEQMPQVALGHSLGEYNALLLAGCFDFGAGLKLVQRRAQCFHQIIGGTMAAVVGVPPCDVTRALANAAISGVEIANYNTPTQVVLAGPRALVDECERPLQAAGARLFVRLKVGGPFHSSYMVPARDAFAEYLQTFSFRPPSLTVVANFTARPYEREKLAATLLAQICSPVRWAESIAGLIERLDPEFVEIGYSGVLTRLLEAIRAERPNGASRELATAGPVTMLKLKRHTTEPRSEVPRSPEPPLGRNGSSPPCVLGSSAFRADYSVRLAYLVNAPLSVRASQAVVARAARAGLLAVLGTAGDSPQEVAQCVAALSREIGPTALYAAELRASGDDRDAEQLLLDGFARSGVRVLYVTGETAPTPALVRYRATGLAAAARGDDAARRRLIVRVSRPDVASRFLIPPDAELLRQLVQSGQLSAEDAAQAAVRSVADDLVVGPQPSDPRAPSAFALVPAIRRVQRALRASQHLENQARIGATGGLGTPETVAAAFVVGADFVETTSLNSCTAEAPLSEGMKDLLSELRVEDFELAPALDGFELGHQVEVAGKDTLFPSRARYLYELYRSHHSIDELDQRVRRVLERSYFGRSLAEVTHDVRARLATSDPRALAEATRDPRRQLGLVLRRYLEEADLHAQSGRTDSRLNWLVRSDAELGAFNTFAPTVGLGAWRNRHVDVVADCLMEHAANVMLRHAGDGPRHD
jgi:trans-AT polyketide synthase/acyltransferase/oxidoreductase domain-containing protein